MNYSHELNTYPDDEDSIDLAYNEDDKLRFIKLKTMPDLSRFHNLKILYCYRNEIKQISGLEMPNLESLFCSNNKLVSLTNFPNLTYLNCSNNQLSYLPNMPKIKTLYCLNNKLTSIMFNLSNLEALYCMKNKITHLSTMPNIKFIGCANNKILHINASNGLKKIDCLNNPIYDIIGNDIEKLRKLTKFRNFYFSLKYKQQIVNWLWELVRKPRIEKMYHPTNLLKFMNENDNWEDEIENW
jgi:Leucine-rich repeat (LRR) protein